MDLRTAIDKASRTELLQALTHIVVRLALTEPTDADKQTDDIILSPKQLEQRCPLSVNTLYRYIWNGQLVEGVHYTKKKNRVLFSWNAMKAWLTTTDQNEVTDPDTAVIPTITKRRTK